LNVRGKTSINGNIGKRWEKYNWHSIMTAACGQLRWSLRSANIARPTVNGQVTEITALYMIQGP